MEPKKGPASRASAGHHQTPIKHASASGSVAVGGSASEGAKGKGKAPGKGSSSSSRAPAQLKKPVSYSAQRRAEIYALNAIMTKHEEKRFQDFSTSMAENPDMVRELMSATVEEEDSEENPD